MTLFTSSSPSAMSPLTLDTLPEALILEMCNRMDIFGLVSFSTVNQRLRNLAKTFPSFWLSTLQQCRLFLPLPTHRPYHEYTAEELYQAAHRAVLVEQNITSSRPQLRSWKHITWPYEAAPEIEEDAQSAEWETSEQAIHMHLSHPNGEWMFIVSSNNVLRVIHLRTGKLALVYGEDAYALGRDVEPVIAWAVEFREENEASLVMNCHERSEEEEGVWHPAIRIFDIHFHPEKGIATKTLINTKIMDAMPAHLDLAGGYIISVDAKVTHPVEAGTVRLIRWSDMEEINLPKLYPSIRIAAFQEYFVSLGVSDINTVAAQIVGYPDPSISSPQKQHIPVHTYKIDWHGSLNEHGHPICCQICHFYTGARESSVQIWLRPGGHGIWSVYSVPFDLVDLRSSAMRISSGRACDGEELCKSFRPREEQRTVLEERHLRHWCAPVASGRRFLWWRRSSEEADNLEDAHYFKLFLSVIDDLAPSEALAPGFLNRRFRLDPTVTYDEGSPASLQLQASREAEIPEELSKQVVRVYMFVMEEWSGTILVQMYPGDLWVLRYGKA